ncbi:peptidoglycan-binding domain-containing protein [Kitasatospora sp. NPDC002227]|uniref:peptidoglycan-binding domain-containing protein n=1 Tax=Kitasatospora sp. NPDC002227 TaxID=3154773 RepID=UPI003326863B
MPAEHPAQQEYPRPAGNPDFEDTAVLPHTEGPPLVRPYVGGGAPSVPDQGPQTDVLPPAQEPRPYLPPQRTVGAAYSYHGGRAERRQQQRRSSGRRRAVILAAGAGIAAVGAGLALTLPGSDAGNRTVAGAADSYQPDAGIAYPSLTPATASRSASPSPSKASPSHKPSPSPSPSHSATPSPSPTPSTPSIAPSPSPTPSTPSIAPSPAGPRTLSMGMSGADVSAMQQQLADAMYWKYDDSLVTGTFDPATRKAVQYFQRLAAVTDDPSGVFGPATRASLANYA